MHLFPWTMLRFDLSHGSISSRGGCGGSWGEWVSLFKAPGPGEFITAFSRRERLVSDTEGQATSGTVSFIWDQTDIPIPSFRIPFFNSQYHNFHMENSQDCEFNCRCNSTTYTIKCCVWCSAILALSLGIMKVLWFLGCDLSWEINRPKLVIFLFVSAQVHSK